MQPLSDLSQENVLLNSACSPSMVSSRLSSSLQILFVCDHRLDRFAPTVCQDRMMLRKALMRVEATMCRTWTTHHDRCFLYSLCQSVPRCSCHPAMKFVISFDFFKEYGSAVVCRLPVPVTCPPVLVKPDFLKFTTETLQQFLGPQVESKKSALFRTTRRCGMPSQRTFPNGNWPSHASTHAHNSSWSWS